MILIENSKKANSKILQRPTANYNFLKFRDSCNSSRTERKLSLLHVRETRNYFSKELEDVINVSVE